MVAPPLHGHHSAPLVILSLAIAVVSSYTALGLVLQARRASRGYSSMWMVGGGLCMGTGVWATHFVAVLALRLGIPFSFRLDTTVLSWALAVLGSTVTFLLASNRVRVNVLNRPVLLGGLTMGCTMSLMHYVGLNGMYLQADPSYNPWLVVASVAAAIGGSCPAMFAAFGPKATRWASPIYGMVAPTLLSAAIGALHFLGMRAVVYFPNPSLPLPIDADRDWLAILVSLAIFAIFVIGLLSRTMDEQAHVRLTNTLESMTQAFTAFDHDWRYTYLNAAAEEMLGVKREDLLGRVLWEVSPHLKDNHFHRRYQRAIEERRPVHFNDFLPARSMWFAVSAYPTPDGISIYYRDITKDVQFRHLQETLVANVSHDLRAPIASVRATIEALHDDMIPADRRPTFLASALHELDRMSRMTDDLMHLSRLDSGTLLMEKVALSLAPLFEETRDAWVQRYSAAGVELHVDLPPVVVLGDYDQLARVLSNLLENALKFTPPGGAVRVSSNCEDGFVRITVADNGMGIAEEDLPYIWDRFYTADRARTRNGGTGSGLGLTIVKKLVEQMGGTITVKSRPSQGATFSFTLPLGE